METSSPSPAHRDSGVSGIHGMRDMTPARLPPTQPPLSKSSSAPQPRPTRTGSALGRTLSRIATASSRQAEDDRNDLETERFPDLDTSDEEGDEQDGHHAQAPNGSALEPSGARPDTTTHFPRNTVSLGSSNRFKIANKNLNVQGKSSKRDGRLKLSIRHAANKGVMLKALDASLRRHLPGTTHPDQQVQPADGASTPDTALGQRLQATSDVPIPKLNIVIMVIGSRGDIQPFIKIGRVLKEQYGHRVRVATHPAFRKFVKEDCGLKHFSVGGDPSELMAFMVRNPGLIPDLDTIRKGEIGRRRSQMYEMFGGFWRACINSKDDKHDDDSFEPFVADAIIANPPSFAHVHCAERLGCPLHIMFTFPYSPTQQFPHPLANIKAGSTDAHYANFLSYPLVEMMTWQGLGDLVNDFRTKTLGLDPVSTLWAPGQLYRMKVPYTYLWSPGLVPKPADWGPEIDIAGFVFLDLASNFKPPKDLEAFLNAGDAPIYIGFGSIVLDDPEAFTKMIFEAVRRSGVRAVINKGWGGFGGKGDAPKDVFMLDNTPHDWLFPKCRAVIHHGGAGTTAIGLKCAKPTMIVPFFGDQPFWGSMVADAKAGAHECINHKQLTIDKLVKGIEECLSEEAQENVQKLADSIAREGDGAANAVRSFHAALPLQNEGNMRCSVIQDRVAVWQLKRSRLRLSALAAELLVSQGKTTYKDMRLRRQYDWNDFQGSGGPITGGGAAVFDMVTGFSRSVGEGPLILGRDVQKRALHEHRRIRHMYRKHKREHSHQQSEQEGSDTAANGNLGLWRHSVSAMDQASRVRGTGPQIKRADSAFPVGSTMNSNAIYNELRRERTLPPALPLSSADSEPVPSSPSQRPVSNRQVTQDSILSVGPPHGLIIKDTAMGVVNPLGKIAKFPMDLLVGVADGFHNLPRLYGDTTVRRPTRITGYKSGLKAAGRELVLGTYDAFSGLVVLPYKDVQQRGAIGLATGIGKGLGGLVSKECAAVIGPLGYTMKGIHREFCKAQTPVSEVRRKRMAQGKDQLARLSESERRAAQEAAGRGWKVMAEIWEEGDRIKRGLWDPETNTTRDRSDSWIGGRMLAGVMGRIKYEAEVKRLDRLGAFENVEETERALEARKRGLSLDEALRKERQQHRHVASNGAQAAAAVGA